MRVLVLEDDRVIAENIATILRVNTIAVDLVHTLDDAYELATSVDYDALIFDRKIDLADSAKLVAKLRAEGAMTPILLLTALSQKDEVVAGLDYGADDYLAKPFDSNELLARVRAISRRGNRVPSLPIICVSDLTLDTNRHHVERKGKVIELSPREYAILEYLAQNAGHCVERMDILSHAWDDTLDLFSNTLDVHIAYLRKKIDHGHKHKLIQTVKGKGYMLCES